MPRERDCLNGMAVVLLRVIAAEGIPSECSFILSFKLMIQVRVHYVMIPKHNDENKCDANAAISTHRATDGVVVDDGGRTWLATGAIQPPQTSLTSGLISLARVEQATLRPSAQVRPR